MERIERNVFLTDGRLVLRVFFLFTVNSQLLPEVLGRVDDSLCCCNQL